MSDPDEYSLAYTRAARRSMNRLPATAALAMHEHLTGPVAANPRRLGKQLEAPYEGLWSTRRGEYRAIYAIDDAIATVSVVAVAHRRDAYRSP